MHEFFSGEHAQLSMTDDQGGSILIENHTCFTFKYEERGKTSGRE